MKYYYNVLEEDDGFTVTFPDIVTNFHEKSRNLF